MVRINPLLCGLTMTADRFTGFPWADLPKDSVVVDCGGGIGSLSVMLAEAYPHLRFVVEDRAPVVANGPQVRYSAANLCVRDIDLISSIAVVHSYSHGDRNTPNCSHLAGSATRRRTSLSPKRRSTFLNLAPYPNRTCSSSAQLCTTGRMTKSASKSPHLTAYPITERPQSPLVSQDPRPLATGSGAAHQIARSGQPARIRLY